MSDQFSGGGSIPNVIGNGGVNLTANQIPKASAAATLVDSAYSDVAGVLTSTGAFGEWDTPNGNLFIRWKSGNTLSLGAVGASNIQISSAGLVTLYGGNLATAGMGVAVVYGATSQKAETAAADANVLTYTPPAVVGTYRVAVAISVASATNGVISYTVTYKDSNGNAQTAIAGPLFQHGTAAPNTTFTTSAAGNYSGQMLIDVDNSATAIVVKWVGGGTTSAKMSATIERLQ